MFYHAAKVFWILAQPSNLILFTMAAGIIALLLGRRKVGLWLSAPAMAGLVLIGLFPVGQWLLMPLENRFPAPAAPPVDIDGIVVLGGGIDLGVARNRGVVAFRDTGERFITMVELARRYPEARLVFSGGRGWLAESGPSEAEVMRGFFRDQGVDEARMIFEDQARNTYENALLAKPLAAPQPGERWLLITSVFHMPRAVGVFRQVGWPMMPYPVDYRTTGAFSVLAVPNAAQHWSEFDLAIQSWLGLVAYWLSGRIPTLLPAP